MSKDLPYALPPDPNTRPPSFAMPEGACDTHFHIFGLPDRRTGLCADLMSGSSAPIACRNAFPNATEAATVNRRFAGSLAPAMTTERELVYID